MQIEANASTPRSTLTRPSAVTAEERWGLSGLSPPDNPVTTHLFGQTEERKVSCLAIEAAGLCRIGKAAGRQETTLLTSEVPASRSGFADAAYAADEVVNHWHGRKRLGSMSQ